jgi:5,5'-dehydrodivanillate O-demethylase oxygenase subunit
MRCIAVTGQAADAYRAQRDRYRTRRAVSAPVSQVAADVLAGKLRLADVADHPNLVRTEELVAQVGQGMIADRTTARRGRSDGAVILLRRLWEQELRALADECPG